MSKYIIQFDNLMNYPTSGIPNEALIDIVVAIYNSQNEWVIMDSNKEKGQKRLENQISEIIIDFGKGISQLHSDVCKSLCDILEGDIPGNMQTKLRNIQNLTRHLRDKEIIEMVMHRITV